MTGADEHGEDAGRRTRRGRSPRRARIANSSPPNRATVSPSRSALRRRWPQISSNRSPAAWPSESLTCLKSSRSRKATTAGSPASASRRCAARTRSGSGGPSASPRTPAGAGARRAGAAGRRGRAAPSSPVSPTTSRAITSTVPIQEKRSLRTATSRLLLGGGAQPGAQAHGRGLDDDVHGRGAVEVTGAHQRELVLDRGPQPLEGDQRGPGAEAAHRAQPPQLGPHRLQPRGQLGLDGERHATARGRLPLERADAVGVRLDGDQRLVASRRSSAWRCSAAMPSVAAVATMATTVAIRMVRFPRILPGVVGPRTHCFTGS